MKEKIARAFVAILLFVMISTCITGYRVIGSTIIKRIKAVDGFKPIEIVNSLIKGITDGTNEGIVFHDLWIDLYGGIQKALGKKIVFDADPSKTVVIGSDEKLYFASNVLKDESDDETLLLKNTAALKDFYAGCQLKGIDFLFVTAPSKYCAQSVTLPIQNVPDSRAIAEEFSRILDQYAVPHLNLHQKWTEVSGAYSDGFFVTDHHWTIKTAFWGYQKIIEYLNENTENRIEEQYFRDKYYSISVEKDAFLGSMGTRVGSFYAGRDDIDVIYPAFETDFLVEYQTKTLGTMVRREGSFDEAILDYPATYNMYITSDNPEIHVDNRKNNTGRKVLLIKDSFGVPVASWLSCMADELWVIDLRYEQKESMVDFVQSHGIDTVIVLYNSGTLENRVLFEFDEISTGK